MNFLDSTKTSDVTLVVEASVTAVPFASVEGAFVILPVGVVVTYVYSMLSVELIINQYTESLSFALEKVRMEGVKVPKSIDVSKTDAG